MQSKRRVIVGWRQVPVQKIRSRVRRPAEAPAVGAPVLPDGAQDADEEPGEAPSLQPPGRSK